jgi:hypothetical protein
MTLPPGWDVSQVTNMKEAFMAPPLTNGVSTFNGNITAWVRRCRLTVSTLVLELVRAYGVCD